MLSFVQSWFNPASAPIGVDLGSDCLRLAQVEPRDQEHHLAAVAATDVPAHVRNDVPARFAFFAESIGDLLSAGKFQGRRVVLNLPASMIQIQHLRLPKMDDVALKKSLAWEARGKLPFDPSQALLRHIIAGDVFHDQESKYEVILLAARRDLVEQYLSAANKARLTVVGMTVEPKAIVDCFSHVFRRASDKEISTCFIDIGCSATRAVVARDGKIQFARAIPIGGEHFSRAVAAALSIPLDQARQLRIKAAGGNADEPAAKTIETPAAEIETGNEQSLEGTGFALLNAAVSAAERCEPKGSAPQTAVALAAPVAAPSEGPITSDRRRMDEACQEPLARLTEELSLCRRYYEATFHNQPIQRLIFVGGEANQRGLCQQIAREMGVAAQVGDPLCRMGKTAPASIEGVIDRRLPQPNWAVAVGLSMGGVAVEAATDK